MPWCSEVILIIATINEYFIYSELLFNPQKHFECMKLVTLVVKRGKCKRVVKLMVMGHVYILIVSNRMWPM